MLILTLWYDVPSEENSASTSPILTTYSIIMYRHVCTWEIYMYYILSNSCLPLLEYYQYMPAETNLHVKCCLEIYIVYGVEKIDMKGGDWEREWVWGNRVRERQRDSERERGEWEKRDQIYLSSISSTSVVSTSIAMCSVGSKHSWTAGPQFDDALDVTKRQHDTRTVWVCSTIIVYMYMHIVKIIAASIKLGEIDIYLAIRMISIKSSLIWQFSKTLQNRKLHQSPRYQMFSDLRLECGWCHKNFYVSTFEDAFHHLYYP